VFYLLFREGKFRLGIIGGIRDNIFLSPFSAPFGGFTFISPDIRLQHIEYAVKLLKNWATEKGLLSVIIVLPPSIYESSFIAKQINCLWRENFKISNLEWFDESYPEKIWYNARKNLRISLNAGFQVKMCTSIDEKRMAYEIIRKNRESRGFPLRMSWEQVYDTIQVIPADFFLINYDNKIYLAAAIVFHVSETTVLVVYWGDLQGYSEMKPMNFLSNKVFEHYKATGKKFIDIGPSTENSLPNYGLCEFKEGIGCRIDPKYTLIKNLS
jgi:hypothetical protein